MASSITSSRTTQGRGGRARSQLAEEGAEHHSDLPGLSTVGYPLATEAEPGQTVKAVEALDQQSWPRWPTCGTQVP